MKRYSYIIVILIMTFWGCCLASCSKEKPSKLTYTQPIYLPTPYDMTISSDACELVITTEIPRNMLGIASDIRTMYDDNIFTWCNVITYRRWEKPNIEDNWYQVEYISDTETLIKISANNSSYKRYILMYYDIAERDMVTIIQEPGKTGTHVDLDKGGTVCYVEYINQSSHVIAIRDMIWRTEYVWEDEPSNIALDPGQSRIVHKLKDEFQQADLMAIDKVDKEFVPLLCDGLRPISCSVIFDGTYELKHSYSDNTSGQFSLTDYKNYELSGGKLSEEEQAAFRLKEDALKWTLTYTFTDADYEYAVANGNIR